MTDKVMPDLFKLQQTGKEAGGALGGSAPYAVIFSRECTIREFIDYVVSNRLDEWGDIRVVDRTHKWYECPKCDYRKGQLISDYPEYDLDRKVLKADAIGGWSNMDYFLFTEEIENDT